MFSTGISLKASYLSFSSRDFIHFSLKGLTVCDVASLLVLGIENQIQRIMKFKSEND